MGDYWVTNSNTPTPLGTLVSAAKDQDCPSSIAQLACQFEVFVRGIASSGFAFNPNPLGVEEGQQLVVNTRRFRYDSQTTHTIAEEGELDPYPNGRQTLHEWLESNIAEEGEPNPHPNGCKILPNSIDLRNNQGPNGHVENAHRIATTHKEGATHGQKVLMGNVVVVPIPSGRPNGKGLAEQLARSAATGLGAQHSEAITRRNFSKKMRNSPLAQRPAIVGAAGFEFKSGKNGKGLVAGKVVVLVDDVVLTGTTLNHVAGLLKASGASKVVGLAAARTRLSQFHSPALSHSLGYTLNVA